MAPEPFEPCGAREQLLAAGGSAQPARGGAPWASTASMPGVAMGSKGRATGAATVMRTGDAASGATIAVAGRRGVEHATG